MRRILALGFLFLPLLACATARVSGLDRAMRDDLQEARQMVQTGHYRQAIDDLTMILELNPKSEEARLVRAVAYQALEEFPEAIRDYEAVIKQNPKSSKSYYNLGMIYSFKINEPRKALNYFDRFLSLEPQHAKSLQVAKIMCSIDSTGEDADLGDPALQESLARSMAIRDPEQRRKGLLQLAQKHPHSPMPLFLIAKTYERERDYGKAIDMYEGALERGPTCGPCHQSLGELLLKKGKKQEAEAHFNKARLFSNQTLPSSETGAGDSEGTSSGGADSSGA